MKSRVEQYEKNFHHFVQKKHEQVSQAAARHYESTTCMKVGNFVFNSNATCAVLSKHGTQDVIE